MGLEPKFKNGCCCSAKSCVGEQEEWVFMSSNNTGSKPFLTAGCGSLCSLPAAGAWLVTMVIPSLGQAITAARALAQMVLTADASLPGAVTKTLLLSSLRVFVILGTLVSPPHTLGNREAGGRRCL